MFTRPDHPDFWALSEILVELDRQSETAGFDLPTHLADMVDTESLLYVAQERAKGAVLHQFGEPQAGGEMLHLYLLAMASAAFIDGFTLGQRYKRERP